MHFFEQRLCHTPRHAAIIVQQNASRLALIYLYKTHAHIAHEEKEEEIEGRQLQHPFQNVQEGGGLTTTHGQHSGQYGEERTYDNSFYKRYGRSL